MMRSRGLLGLIFGVMLALVMGSAVTAQEICSSNFPDGIVSAADIDTNIDTDVETGFVAGLLGTQEVFNGNVIGGLDWLYNQNLLMSPNFPSTEVGSQVIAWWTLANDRQSWVQVTNTNPALSTEVHVVVLDENCDEVVNFCDEYTPNDTVIYDMSNLVRNNPTMGAVGVPGVPVPGGTQLTGEGTIVITPTIDCSEAAPLNYPAVDFNFLQGTTTIIDEDVDFGVNTFNRYAITSECENEPARTEEIPNNDPEEFFELGELVIIQTDDPNTPNQNEEITNINQNCAFANVLPTTLTKDYSTIGAGPAAADLVILQFRDNYDALVSGDGYEPQPLFSDILGSIVDVDENPGSCGNESGCFIRLGIDTENQLSDNVDLQPEPEEEICTGGVDEDGDTLVDCADPDCDTDPACETAEDCADGMDNDGDGDTDCADAGCVGVIGPDEVACEASEVSCDDGIDNDGDGLVDGDDPDCVTGDGDGDGDGDGGGDGCSVVSTDATAGTSAVNFLLPMMVFGLGIMVRRLRRKK